MCKINKSVSHCLNVIWTVVVYFVPRELTVGFPSTAEPHSDREGPKVGTEGI